MTHRIREQLGLAAAGGAQGLAIWLLIEGWPAAHWAQTIAASTLTFVAVTGLVFHFARTGEEPRRLRALVVGTGAVYAIVAAWVGASIPTDSVIRPGDEEIGFTWGLTSAVTLFVLGPFLQIVQRTGRPHFPYRDLFLHAWNNFFVALVGGLFLGALWTVLLLWAALFDLIGIEFFADLFEEGAFAWPTSGAAMGFGIALGRESERVVATLRGVTLAIFRGLLPLVSLIALIFVATLPFTGLDALWATNHASQLLLTWVALTVVFLNAVYQDGTEEAPLPAPLRRLVDAALVVMMLFTGLSLYALSLRIDQYGLTPSRMWAVLVAIVLGCYAAGYAFAVLRRGEPWLRAVRPVNLGVALLIVALGLLAHTPLLDPIRWSVSSQVARLLEGRADATEFDYGYLRFKLGRHGSDRLDALGALESHPRLSEIHAGVARAREASSYWDWGNEGKAISPTRIAVVPAGVEIPDALRDIARGRFGQSCRSAPYCAAIRAELTGRPPEEWVLAAVDSSTAKLLVYSEADGRYAYLGRLEAFGPQQSAATLEQAIAEMRFRSVEPVHRDLEIAGERYRLRPR